MKAALLLSCLTFVAAGQGANENGYLKTNVDPGRAGVFVDGKYLGSAANFKVGQKFSLSPGEHEVKLSDPRYEEVTKKVTILPGKTTKIAEKLQPLPLAKPPFAKVKIVGFDKYAAVYVNDKFNGHADEFSNFAQNLLLPPGDYTIKVVPRSGGSPHEEKVSLVADKVTIVQAK